MIHASRPTTRRLPGLQPAQLPPFGSPHGPEVARRKVTTTICRDCHTAIHALFTNKELEQKYYTVASLLTHDEMRKTIAFISKQDPGGRVRTRASRDRSRKR